MAGTPSMAGTPGLASTPGMAGTPDFAGTPGMGGTPLGLAPSPGPTYAATPMYGATPGADTGSGVPAWAKPGVYVSFLDEARKIIHVRGNMLTLTSRGTPFDLIAGISPKLRSSAASIRQRSNANTTNERRTCELTSLHFKTRVTTV